MSSDVLDAIVDDPVAAANMHPAPQATPAVPQRMAGKAKKGKRGQAGIAAGNTESAEPDANGVPQQPTFLLELKPVSSLERLNHGRRLVVLFQNFW